MSVQYVYRCGVCAETWETEVRADSIECWNCGCWMRRDYRFVNFGRENIRAVPKEGSK